MKKASIIINAVLAAAVIVLFILHFTSKSSSPQAGEQTGESPSSGSIVFIQIDSLFNKYDMFNDLKSELESKAQVIQNDLDKKGRAFQRDVADYEEKVKKGLITRSQVETLQSQLSNREIELRQFSGQKQMEMAEEEQVMIRRVMDALEKYLEKFNAEKKYALIINTQGTSTILKGDSLLNITNEVVKGLNEEYVATRGKK
ncbi:MAG: OmpH family outer membrane protein [Bacteroidales bacterium]|nr:OmpH family outer membrane protein [Bacteroidales bacterium]MDD3988844.1 OmpH family outer membrane protein [Bacteroidales bacterium]MDD4639520.1 OmpH family outer membrane protein [Bacteroidales bacterium]